MHSMGKKFALVVTACAVAAGGAAAPNVSAHHSQSHKLCAPGQHPAPQPGFKPGACKRRSAATPTPTRTWSGIQSGLRI
jgi:hypothetical protein